MINIAVNTQQFTYDMRPTSKGKKSEYKVRAKKYLGQHFLNDQKIAEEIVSLLNTHKDMTIMEIGPGMGVLTQFLVKSECKSFLVVEIDHESVLYLKEHFDGATMEILHADFLKLDWHTWSPPIAVIGNFPYNISSQIFFNILEHYDSVSQVVCMLQKEVADRIACPPGSRTYGILSVLLQTYFTIKRTCIVEPGAFSPPPKVRSAVLDMKRNNRAALPCNYSTLKRVVKQAFQNRRKTLRNSIKSLASSEIIASLPYMDMRAEQLTCDQFIELSVLLEKKQTLIL